MGILKTRNVYYENTSTVLSIIIHLNEDKCNMTVIFLFIMDYVWFGWRMLSVLIMIYDLLEEKKVSLGKC